MPPHTSYTENNDNSALPTYAETIPFAAAPQPLKVAPAMTPVASIPTGMNYMQPSSMESFMRMTQPLRSAMLLRARELRGVPAYELEMRFQKAQKMMNDQKIDCMLLTTEPDVYYFTGLATRFWNSPTRPLYLVIPAKGGRPIAVVPSCFPSFGKACWIGPENVRTWPAPQPEDDGVTLLSDTLTELCEQYNRVGFQMGHETHIRAPLADVDRIRKNLIHNNLEITDCSNIVVQLRNIKSPFEIERMRHCCDIASAAFAALPARLNAQLCQSNSMDQGITEREAQQAMRQLLHEFGADETPYVMTQSGQQGYDNIVLEPEDHVLQNGDLLIIDTGIRFESYFCDFDRNFIVGGKQYLQDDARITHEKLWDATEAAFQAASKEGCKACDLFSAQVEVMGMDPTTCSTGRMGHGLGLQLTELFSNIAEDETAIVPGVTFTIEPGMLVQGSDELMIVHEENAVIGPDGQCEWMSDRAPREMHAVLDFDEVTARRIFQEFERKYHMMRNFSQRLA